MEVNQHWNEYKSRYLLDIYLLIEQKRDCSAMLLMCAFIDSMASYYIGRISNKGVGKAFRLFAQKYMPRFKNIGFGDLLFDTGEKVKDLIDMLYFCYRNGLVHEGHLPYGIKLVRSEALACKVCAIGSMELSITGMFNYLCEAVELFENDLFNDIKINNNYKSRMMYLNRNRFKKDHNVVKTKGAAIHGQPLNDEARRTSHNKASTLTGAGVENKEKEPHHMPSPSRSVTKVQARRRCWTLDDRYSVFIANARIRAHSVFL